ncbi:MAG: response regulator [Bacteroidales bacterium]
MLSRMGHKVLKASNGYEALRLLELGRCPTIFMDIQMPVLSGIDVLRIIQERYPRLKVVAVGPRPGRDRAAF